eukprot:gene5095-5336_t
MNEQPDAAGGTVLSLRADPVVEPKWYLKISEAWHTMSQHLGLKRLQELIQGTCSLTDEPVWLLGLWYGLVNKDTNTAFMPEEATSAGPNSVYGACCGSLMIYLLFLFDTLTHPRFTSGVFPAGASGPAPGLLQQVLVHLSQGLSSYWLIYLNERCWLGLHITNAGHISDAGDGSHAAAAGALETAAVLPAEEPASMQLDQLQLLQLFLDMPNPASPFSIHNLCIAGTPHGVVAGQWVGPWMLCKTLAAAAEQAQQQLLQQQPGQSLGLQVHVVCDPGGGAPQLQPDSLKRLLQVDATTMEAVHSSTAGQAAAPGAQGQLVLQQQRQRGLLLLIPLTLGVGKSVGIVGGRPGASLFFMGVQGSSSVLYLDPHEAQEAPALPRDVATFHCSCPRLMPLSAIDPSLAIGFYCGSTDELDNLIKRLQQLADSSGGAPLMTVEMGECPKQQQQQQEQQSDILSADPTPDGQGTADDWECEAVKTTGVESSKTGLTASSLIVYQKDKAYNLALLLAPDGKKNWFACDQRGRKFSLQARMVSLVLPGSNYNQDDLQRFTTTATAADASLLEIGWAVAADDNRSYSLPELSKLLFDEVTALDQFVTFQLLVQDRIYFKQDFALKPQGKCPEAADALARQTLMLFKRRPEPDVAAELLTEAGLLRLHEPLPLLRAGRSYGQESEFEPSLEAAAEALLQSPPPDLDEGLRQDLTHLTVFTIDDASTLEVDDALSISRDQQGNLLLWVHIADPTRWVMPVKMFPRCLGEGAFSLVSDSSDSNDEASSSKQQECCAFSICATLTEDGALERIVGVTPSTIKISHRLTYLEADADLGLGPGLCQFEDLQALFEAARLRRSWRMSEGCIDIDLPEAKLEVPLEDLDCPTPAITCTKVSQWESASRMMVAEMMILAGEAVGRLGKEHGLPLPYRGQEPPKLPSAEVLDTLPDGPCKGYALRRCMKRSVIEPFPVRHSSLALDSYVQFTSPIRRYSDMLAHWNLKAHLRGQPPPFSAAAITSITAEAAESGREAGRAENEVTKYWAAELLRQQGSKSWEGQVLGWFRPEMNLVSVSLEELGLESIVKVEFPVRPGDRLVLRLAEVDVRNGFYRLYVHDRLDSAAPPAPNVIGEEEEEEEEEGEEEAEQLEAVDEELLEAENVVDEAQELTAAKARLTHAISWRSNALDQQVSSSAAVHGTDMIFAGSSSTTSGGCSEVSAAELAGSDQSPLQLRLDTSGTDGRVQLCLGLVACAGAAVFDAVADSLQCG